MASWWSGQTRPKSYGRYRSIGRTRMDAKQDAQRQIIQDRDRLLALSHRLHAHPEVAWEEERACEWLAEMLAGAGFAVEAGCYGLPTAFVARAGSGPLHLAICAEYDALPDIGHA